jgi:2-dehydro-3-deoxyglucarate aldolase/4-hydroxy-2-oxoheptanedioate aldolase
MTDTPVSQAIADRGLAVGCMLFEFDTPRVMRLLASAGADFALFDLEHTAWDAESLRRAYAAGRGTGVYPITRVVRAQYPLVATALDAGSRGIMAPMVESAEEARVLVESAKYPPAGKRGFGVVMRDELDGGPAAAADRANRDNLVIAQIESAAGIEHAAEIVSVPGIDAVWLGQFDLSLSLGVPGEFSHPRFTEAVDQLLAVCRAAGKPVGQLIASTDDGVAAAAAGFRILAYADVWVFESALREGVAALRSTAPAPPPG